MAGYSGTPLIKKLGFKPGMTIHVVNPPPEYPKTLGRLPKSVAQARTARGPLDAVHVFTTSRRDLERRMPTLLAALQPAGMLWVSWPKKAAKVATDLTEDVIRAVAIAHGVVDVKVCAVDDTWSGLKLVRRLRDR